MWLAQEAEVPFLCHMMFHLDLHLVIAKSECAFASQAWLFIKKLHNASLSTLECFGFLRALFLHIKRGRVWGIIREPLPYMQDLQAPTF